MKVCPYHTPTADELKEYEEWKEDRDEVIEAQARSGCGKRRQ